MTQWLAQISELFVIQVQILWRERLHKWDYLSRARLWWLCFASGFACAVRGLGTLCLSLRVAALQKVILYRHDRPAGELRDRTRKNQKLPGLARIEPYRPLIGFSADSILMDRHDAMRPNRRLERAVIFQAGQEDMNIRSAGGFHDVYKSGGLHFDPLRLRMACRACLRQNWPLARSVRVLLWAVRFSILASTEVRNSRSERSFHFPR
jgi:hypothetical protein